ncbi:MAG TPA: glycosyltransferase family 4 protein [Thermoanaerobaculia bacterium]|nr:glycosyltransferase family 4 protein [Thermoanaerobaculia bacterium]
MRILVVCHPPLAARHGAAQTALTLAEALRARGHDAEAWSPEPLPPGTRWWNLWLRQRRAAEDYAASHGPFDVIDTPAIAATARLARSGALVARSVQPELHYLADAIAGDLRHRVTPRALLHALQGGPRAAAILSGWRRARFILCLGSREHAWMQRHFPSFQSRLGFYVSAPTPAERGALLAIRRQRPSAPRHEGIRFLWIGRWASHKDPGRLLRFFEARAAAFPADTLTIAGCGPAAERAVPAGLLRSGQIRLVPAFEREELPLLLVAHDAGLFTSSLEGWGLSLNEMLEAGLPVFATDAGGTKDLAPYFPQSLRPFPPPDRPELEPAPLEDLEASGYLENFSWPQIALSYERQALAAISQGAR